MPEELSVYIYDAQNTLWLRAFQDLSFQIRKVQPVFSGRAHFGCTCREEGCVAKTHCVQKYTLLNSGMFREVLGTELVIR